MDLEKAQLELEQMKSTLSAKQEEKARLERDKSNVSADQQLQYDLEIREATAAILEQQYNITLKEKEVQRLGNSVGSADVTSPVDGRGAGGERERRHRQQRQSPTLHDHRGDGRLPCEGLRQ